MVKGSLPDISVTMVSGREIHGAFSLIVDDVDSMDTQCQSSMMTGDGNNHQQHNNNNQDTEVLSATGSSSNSSKTSSSNTPLDSPGGPRERIKQIQIEAETRRGEFARLLEEHAQVIRKLKMMEAEEQLAIASSGNGNSSSTSTSSGSTTTSSGKVLGSTQT